MRSNGFSARVALPAIAAGVVAVLLVRPASAQHMFSGHGSDTAIHGVPPSVTSFGFGGHSGFHGVPASVTSPGFGSSGFRIRQRPFGFRRRRPEFISPFYGAYLYPYGLPYDFGDYVEDPGVDDSMEQQYTAPGPTIFDSHGIAGGNYARPRPPADDEDYRSGINSRPAQEQEMVAEQPSTLLVFKDGHQVEVENYAIVGPILYDLSGGRTKKVALAELDLPATVKQNDDRGVDFKLPAGVKLN